MPAAIPPSYMNGTMHRAIYGAPISTQIITLNDAAFERYNLDLEGLTNQLNIAKKQNKFLEKKGLRRVNSTVNFDFSGRTRSFAETLDKEVEKIVLFYLQTQGEIAGVLGRIRRNLDNVLEQDIQMIADDKLEPYFDQYRYLGSQVVRLLNYLDANVVGLRKIIKRHDLLFDQKMGSMYFNNRMGSSSENPQLVQLYRQEGIMAIIGSIRQALEELHHVKGLTASGRDGRKLASKSVNSSPHQRGRVNSLGTKHRMKSFSSIHNLADYASMSISPNKRTKSSGNLFGSAFPSPEAVQSTFDFDLVDLEPILKEIEEAANRVLQSQKMSISEYQATHSLMAIGKSYAH